MLPDLASRRSVCRCSACPSLHPAARQRSKAAARGTAAEPARSCASATFLYSLHDKPPNVHPPPLPPADEVRLMTVLHPCPESELKSGAGSTAGGARTASLGITVRMLGRGCRCLLLRRLVGHMPSCRLLCAAAAGAPVVAGWAVMPSYPAALQRGVPAHLGCSRRRTRRHHHLCPSGSKNPAPSHPLLLHHTCCCSVASAAGRGRRGGHPQGAGLPGGLQAKGGAGCL